VSSKTRRKPTDIPKTETPPAAPEARSRLAYALASVLLLIPCNWQPRIEAGDLSSHVYNAWLAQLIGKGQAPGLAIARQTTNILFDLVLGGLMRLAGPGAAERIAVSLCVLTFAWGAFAFVSVVAGRRAWHMLPAIAMLAYGWVYHMGFFNFYWSLGMCFGALALLWNPTPRRMAAAVALLALAYLTHALPVAWTLGVLLYRWLARRATPRQQLYQMGAAALAIFAVRMVLGSLMFTRWVPAQIILAAGVDQISVFDGKYAFPLVGLLMIWVLLLLGCPVRRVLTGIPFQVCVLTAFAIFTLPLGVLLPGYKHLLSFIPHRMSLALAICLCAVLAGGRVRRFQHYLAAAVALVFFGFLFRDEMVLNDVERQMAEVVERLPAGQRVINGVASPDLRIDPLTHMIDRVCVGRCYSYANYEPSTAQFRVRATAENPIVVSVYEDSFAMQSGSYVVKLGDVPLYEVMYSPSTQLFLRSLAPGTACGVTYWDPL